MIKSLAICTVTNSSGNADKCWSSVASDGKNYMVVWADARNIPPPQYEIYGARIDTAGNITATPKLTSYRYQASGGIYNPEIAWGPGSYLLVWSDFRTTIEDDIYGALISSAGARINSTGDITICSQGGDNNTLPSVAWTGTDYYVAWQSCPVLGGQSDICCGRVDSSGTVMDAGGVLVSQAPYSETAPIVLGWGAPAYDYTWILYTNYLNGINQLLWL